MGVAAEQAVRAWINSKKGTLTGQGRPLSNGAFLLEQRSPATGAYARIIRTPGGASANLVAEPGAPTAARVTALVYHPVQEQAEAAAVALAEAWDGLQGAPEACGDTGVVVLATDNLAWPVDVPQPPDSGEPYCLQVSADFVLM
jgi:hypothetical protein